MAFRMTTEDIEFSLEIRDYRTPADSDCRYNWDNWCKCDLWVRVGDYLDYSVVDDEFLASCEVLKLSRELEELLNGSLKKDKTIGFTEPDLTFELHPKIRADLDIYAELMIELRRPDTNYTGAVLTLPLYRGDLEALREYLKGVMENG